MRIPGVHPPDPNNPKGMAFIFAAGVVDPRPGGYPRKMHPNQLWALLQSWEPTSKMWWDLGLRWHPDLATKWIKGGGQFTVGEIVDEPPDELSMEEYAEAFAKEQFGAMVAEIERVKATGTDFEKKRLYERFQQAGRQASQLAEMIMSSTEEESVAEEDTS